MTAAGTLPARIVRSGRYVLTRSRPPGFARSQVPAAVMFRVLLSARCSHVSTMHARLSPVGTMHARSSPVDTMPARLSPIGTMHARLLQVGTMHA